MSYRVESVRRRRGGFDTYFCNRNKIVFSMKRPTEFARIKFLLVSNLVEANA